MNHDAARGPVPPDDAERDAWLREALRHAPDAAAAPPAALRESILAQARAATAARAARPVAAARRAPPGALATLWAWLARPPVASGFAGLMAAVLVGLMWWDQPMDLARPAPASPAAERAAPGRSSTAPAATVGAPAAAPLAPAAPTVATPAPAPAPAPTPAPTLPAPVDTRTVPAGGTGTPATAALDRPAGRSARSDSAQPQAFPSAERKATAPDAPATQDRLAKQESRAAEPQGVAPSATAPAAAMPPAPAPAPDAVPRAARAQSAEPSVAAAPVVPDTSTTAPAPMQAASPRERERERQRLAAAGEARREAEPGAFPTHPPRAAAEDAAKARDKSVANRREVAEATRPLPLRDATRPLATLLASLAADPSRWSRRGLDGSRAPIDDATRRWLSEVDASTNGRWAVAPPARAARPRAGEQADASAPSAGPLVLLLDGRPAARIAIGESAAFYDDDLLDGTPRRWRAPLPETDAARLASTLPR